MNPPSLDTDTRIFVRRHLQFAWWSILCFLSLGFFLEAMHIYQVDWYLRSAYETRRLMWTLGHVHGSLFGLVHAVFAASLCAMPVEGARWRWLSSPLLLAASVLLPAGFFFGGVTFYSGDPGLAIFLVPIGALMLFVAVFLTAVSFTTLTDTPRMATSTSSNTSAAEAPATNDELEAPSR